MFKWFLIMIATFGFNYAFANSHPIIISGYDDVLKQADNTGLIKSIVKFFDEDKTFAGMPELFNVINQGRTNSTQFYLVSGTSSWFDNQIDIFLTANNFPPRKIFLRNWLVEWSNVDFKIKKIKMILNSGPAESFIVIIDNSSASLEIAETINKIAYPKVLAVYLRKIKKGLVPSGATPFTTAFDIALAEYKENRLNLRDTLLVGRAVLTNADDEKVLPAYADCPVNYQPCQAAASEFLLVCKGLQERITRICKNRAN
ncbi:MAG: DUF2183 domain-containing protein [Bdellovibrionaceae bacterium]|nr:DUF2183 domain-containing protein [Bdellovibrio sp.]